MGDGYRRSYKEREEDMEGMEFNESSMESEADIILIGLNCITLKSVHENLPLYSCSLCKVDFHHHDRHHMMGRHHNINVIWNWEKKTADRISKGLDFPKASTNAKAKAELESVTRRIFKLEQLHLSDSQYELYLVMAGKIPPSKLTQDSQIEEFEMSSSSEYNNQNVEASADLSNVDEEADVTTDPLDDIIAAELNLFNLMDELFMSGEFKPQKGQVGTLEMLHTLGESLLDFQTNKSEIPVDLPRDDVKFISETLTRILEKVKSSHNT